MTNVGTFPLFKLPYLPLANVIHQFDSIHERVDFANLSKRTAILVKSLRDIKVFGLKLILSNSLNLSIIYLNHGKIRHQEWTYLLEDQGWIYEQDSNTLDFPFSVHYNIFQYNNLQKLVDTTFFIFGLSGFEELVVKRAEIGTMEMSRLQNLLGNLNIIKFDRIFSSELYNQVLAAFPFVKNFSMKGKPNNQLITKKLEILELGSRSLRGLGFVNCESLQIKTSILFEKDLNHFLKSWIQGRMPRLKHIRIQYAFPLRHDLIFEGIENAVADLNRKMVFKSYSLNIGDLETTVVQGGVDIESENGARATVTIHNEGTEFQSWNMYVWD